MVEEVSLRIGIDVRPAAAGAASFKRSATEIIRSAEKMGRAVDKAGGGFDKLKKAANDNSRALAGTVRSLSDIETAVSRLSRSSERVRSLDRSLRDLSVSVDMARGRLNEAAMSSANLASNLGGNASKSASSLTSALLDLGLGAGLVVTVLGGFRGLKFGTTIARWITGFGKYAAAVRTATKTMSLFRAVLVTNPLGLVLFGLTTVAGAFLSYRSNADSAADSTISYEDAIRDLNSELQTAAERERELARARREGKLASAEARLEADERRLAELKKELKGFQLVIDAESGSLGPGQSEISAGMRRDALPIAAEIEELEMKVSNLQETMDRVRNAPLVVSQPRGDRSDVDRTGEELERNFTALQDRLDPLGAATRAYTGDLDLLLQAARAELITSAERLELINKLGVATFDARDPVAALRRELEQERNQILMTDDERDISIRLLEIEARLKTAGAVVSDKVRQSLEQELIAIQKLRKGRDEANEAQKKADADLEKRQQDADEEMERRGEAVEEVFGDIRNAAKDSIKDVIKGTESIGDAFQNLADRITDILLDLALEELLGGGTGFSDVFGTVFGGIGSIFGGSGGPGFTGGATNFIDGFNTGGLFDIGSPFHQGGVVGFDGRPVRYHTGGISGLRPDEVPAILQRGEEVLTANDPRHRDNGGGRGGASGGVVVNVNFPNARNTDEARQAGSEIAAKAAAAAQRGMVRKGIG